jgi:hypothetical protein
MKTSGVHDENALYHLNSSTTNYYDRAGLKKKIKTHITVKISSFIFYIIFKNTRLSVATCVSQMEKEINIAINLIFYYENHHSQG